MPTPEESAAAAAAAAAAGTPTSTPAGTPNPPPPADPGLLSFRLAQSEIRNAALKAGLSNEKLLGTIEKGAIAFDSTGAPTNADALVAGLKRDFPESFGGAGGGTPSTKLFGSPPRPVEDIERGTGQIPRFVTEKTPARWRHANKGLDSKTTAYEQGRDAWIRDYKAKYFPRRGSGR